MAGPLTDGLPAARAIARQRGNAQHPFVGAGAHNSAEDSVAWLVPSMVGPSIPSWVLVPTTVQGTQRYGWSPQWSGPASLSGCWCPQCRGLRCMAGPLTDVWPAARAIARQRGRAQHPFQGAGSHCAGDSAAWLVPSLMCCPQLVLSHGSAVMPSIPSWVLVPTTVQGTQRYGWSPQWSGPASLPGCWCPQYRGRSCMAGPLTDVWPAARAIARQRGRAQHPFQGAGAHSAWDSAVWLVPSLMCCPLLALLHGSVVGPSTPSWVLVPTVQGTQLHGGSPH
jgi:hypothetical protein